MERLTHVDHGMSFQAVSTVRSYYARHPVEHSKLLIARSASTDSKLTASSSRPGFGLSYHWDTAAPTSEQLLRAQQFFQASSPELLFSAAEFRTVKNPVTNFPVPEVAFLGRSNVGKSSLLNALMGEKICHTSAKPGRTRTMNFFAVGEKDEYGSAGKLVVLDMPGYGKGSRQEWGTEIMKYLVGRKQLRRTFLLVDPLHGLKRSDEELLSLLRQHSVSHQIILSKVDRILFKDLKTRDPGMVEEKIKKHSPQLDQIIEEVKLKIQPGKGIDGPEALGEIITCSAATAVKSQSFGVNHLRWAVLAATGLGEKKRRIMPSEISSGQAQPITENSPSDLEMPYVS